MSGELAAAVAALVGWVCTAGLFGLWLGERGRRRATERLLGIYKPREGRALPTAPDAEERALQLDRGLQPDQVAERLVAMNPKLSKRKARELADYVTNFFAGGVP